MRLRGFLVVFALATFAAATAQAQDNQNNPAAERGGGNSRAQRLFKDITLTPAQKTKVDSIVAHHRAQSQAATEGGSADGARRDLMRRQVADLRLVLTKEQQEVFDRNAAAMDQRRRD